MPVAIEGRRGRVYLYAVVGALTAFGPMSLDLYLPAFPDLADAYGVAVDDVQLTLSASLIGLGAGQLLYGPVSDRYGRRRPLLAGLALFVAASLGCALAPSLPALVGLRVVQALGGCAGIVIARAMVRDLYRGRELARVLSLVFLVFGLAPVLAPTAGALVLRVASWPWLFVLLAGFGLACVAAVWELPETLPAQRRVAHGAADAVRGYLVILRTPAYLSAALIGALGSVGLFAYISSSPAVLIDGYGVGPTVFGLLFGAVALGIVAMSQVNARLLHHHPVPQVLRTVLVGQTVAAGLLLVAAIWRAPLWLLMVPLAVAVGCVGGVNPNSIALALDPFPQAAASAAALVGAVQMVLGAVVSALLAAAPVTPAVGMAAVMAAAAGGGLLLAAHRRAG